MLTVIEFKEKTCLNVIYDIDEDSDIVEDGEEFFLDGQNVCGDVIEDRGDCIDFQFGNGSIVFNLSKECFKVVKELQVEH